MNKLKYQKNETCSLIYLQHSIVTIQLLFNKMTELFLTFNQQRGRGEAVVRKSRF